jgi:Pyruvate/2-oxoglutarate dehydrogenase complex, dihydrolipoamide dehydrogenase (E3) component, and related enzymes
VSGFISAGIAANNNYKVLLIEPEEVLGGEVFSTKNQDIKIDNLPINEWKNKIVDKLSKNSNVKIVKNSTCFAYLNYNLLLAVPEIDPEKGLNKKNDIRERIWKIRSKKVILATGAIERPIIFIHKDRPGIMLSNRAQKKKISMELRQEKI